MPRKSAASIAAPTSPTANGDASILSHTTTTEPKSPAQKSGRQSTSKNDADSLGVDDLLLPRSLTSRLARGVLPANTSIQKDATLALAKSATVFISYLAAHANEQTSKKTISAQDVLNALKEVELDQVMGLGQVGEDGRVGGKLERELEMFETVISAKRKGYREKVKKRDGGGDGEEGERGEPESKRVRRMSEEEQLLDAQLNGDVSALTDVRSSNGGQEIHTAAHDGVADDGYERNDETEEDPEAEEEEDDDDDDDEEEDEDEDEPAEVPDEDRLEMDGGNDHGGGSRLNLAPDGRVEVGSEDESD